MTELSDVRISSLDIVQKGDCLLMLEATRAVRKLARWLCQTSLQNTEIYFRADQTTDAENSKPAG
jgi:hypothetical protein